MWVGVFGGEVIDHVRRILREEPEDERGSAECRDLLDSSRFILRYPEQDQLRLLLRLCEAAAEKKGPAYVARSSLAHLLMLTLELLRGAADVPHRRLTPAVRRFISLARSAAEQGFPMYVPDLCREAGVSHAHLCRLFGAEVGMPPGKYLDLLRLRSFLRMREERPDMPLETAAAGSGFRNYHHLYRTCLRETGAPPGRAGIMGVGQRAPN
jgi:AraC-like DNA-binding protein